MNQEPDYLKLPEGFDDWTHDKRKSWLTEYMTEYDPLSGFGGTKLRLLRSFRIEKALRQTDKTFVINV